MGQSTEISANYPRCTAEAGSCPLMEQCLRSRVHREASYEGADRFPHIQMNKFNTYIEQTLNI